MNAGVRQSDDFALVKFLRLRFGIEPTGFEKQYFVTRSEEFFGDGDAGRSPADDADLRREGGPGFYLVKVLDQLEMASRPW